MAVLDFAVWIVVARAKRLVGRPESEWEGAYKRAVEGEPRRADILWEWSEEITRAPRRIRLLRNGCRRARSAPRARAQRDGVSPALLPAPITSNHGHQRLGEESRLVRLFQPPRALSLLVMLKRPGSRGA